MFLQADGGQAGWIGTAIFYVLIFAVFYLLLIRPQQQQQKRRREMLSKLRKGDRVVTVGGLHAVITDVQDDHITLELAPNLRVKADRSAVGSVRSRQAESDRGKEKAAEASRRR
ncbi:MAG: preprotein translocase subunit YajC [Armatimonadota bacterium]|nr:preprotein translocase subunit YajC [Armatimonadota bacterium]MDR5697713.1 preprotein translocase subunit YajC [Armatimonadota bacterium]